MAQYTINAELTAEKFKIQNVADGDKKKFLQADGSLEEVNVTYSNNKGTPQKVGGIEAGTTFKDKTVTEMFNMLLYPYQYPTVTNLTCDTSFEYSVAKTLTFTVTGQANESGATPITYYIGTTSGGTTYSSTNTYSYQTTNTTTSVTVYASIKDSNDKTSAQSSKTVYAQYRYWIVAGGSTTPTINASTGSLCNGVVSIKKEWTVSTTSANPYVYIITPSNWSFKIKSLGNEFTAYDDTKTTTYTPTGGKAQTYKIIKFNNPSVTDTTFTIA